jgi:acetyl esterase/lipase
MINTKIPDTISTEAQEFLAAMLQDAASTASEPQPAPYDLDGWDRLYEQGEEAAQALLPNLLVHYQPTTQATTLGGVPVLDIRPRAWSDNGCVLVYVHGGSYTAYSAQTTQISSVPMAHDTGLRVIAVDYTVAPRGRADTAIQQVLDVFAALSSEGYAANKIALYGDSAGGGLATAATLELRDRALPMPAALVLWSPWLDVTGRGDSYQTLATAEPFYGYESDLRPSALAYAGGIELSDPRVSPLYADFAPGFTPALIQGGTRELFLSEFVRFYQKLQEAQQPVVLDLYEGMVHVFQAFGWFLPEANAARAIVAKFLAQHLHSSN